MRPAAVVLVAAVAAGAAGFVAGWLGAVTRDRLAEDRPAEPTHAGTETSVRLGLVHGQDFRDVEFELPTDAVAVRLTAETDDGTLLLRARLSDHEDWDDEALDGAAVQRLDLAEHSHEGFLSGTLVVRVESQYAVEVDRPLSIELRADVIRAATDGTIVAGESWSGSTAPASGFRRTLAVHVPAGTEALRLDIADATTDLDLYASAGTRVVHVDGADRRASSLGSADHLVLGADDHPEFLTGCTVWVTVADPSLHDFAVPFRLVTTLGEGVPPDLAAVPELPQPDDPRARALLAVVEVICGDGGGSGTLVSDTGLVLTAFHVVEAAARASARGDPGDAPEIVIALTLDPRQTARDLFLAEVVHHDHDLDLAMLRIVSGVRGTPLPEGYRFPFVPVARGTAPGPGDALVTLAYPFVGRGTRVTATLSRGVVGGWERIGNVVRVKTDAHVSPGSSGGAALDERWELLGVPVATLGGEKGASTLGSIVPIDLVPAEWWR